VLELEEVVDSVLELEEVVDVDSVLELEEVLEVDFVLELEDGVLGRLKITGLLVEIRIESWKI
jgi:hypothetical protein